MTPYSLFLRDGKLWAARLPEKPDLFKIEYLEECECVICQDYRNYLKRHAQALSEALEVVNPEKFVIKGIIQEGEFYRWPGKVNELCQLWMINEWSTFTEEEYLKAINNGADGRIVVRLVAPEKKPIQS